LGGALRRLQEVGFKAREIAARTDFTRRLLSDLHDCGLAAAMSSMGPLIYVIVGEDDHAAIETIKQLCASCGAEWLGVCEGHNSGYAIER
jgi:beta-ribofuranosylaminobenzene 5'-phosphate synthase